MQSLYDLKMLTVGLTGLAKDALHIHVGLIVFFGACLIFGWKAGGVKAWMLVLLAALLNEASDLYYNYAITGIWQIDDSIHDIVNTMIAPTVIVMLARWSSIFEKTAAIPEVEEETGGEASGDET